MGIPVIFWWTSLPIAELVMLKSDSRWPNIAAMIAALATKEKTTFEVLKPDFGNILNKQGAGVFQQD